MSATSKNVIDREDVICIVDASSTRLIRSQPKLRKKPAANKHKATKIELLK